MLVDHVCVSFAHRPRHAHDGVPCCVTCEPRLVYGGDDSEKSSHIKVQSFWLGTFFEV